MRYDSNDFEGSVIQPLLPNEPRGVKRFDDRRVPNGIFRVLSSGTPWRELPEAHGPRTTCYNRFNRWRKVGVWDLLTAQTLDLMTRYLRRLVGALAVVGLLLGPIGAALAQETLPTEIQTMLAEAAAESDEALLEAVAAAVEANPELAQAIIDEAASLNPSLAEEIVVAATAAVVPAAGPAFPIIGVIAGVAGVGGGAAAAAGGGGGGGGGSAAPAPSPVGLGTTEFDAQEGLGLVNATEAYERGLTGEGVIVAVLDTGLDVTHPEFAGQIAPGGFDFVLGTDEMTDPHGHGTHVSGIIAANKDDTGMHGVAYDAQVLPLRIIDGAGFVVVDDGELAAVIDYSVANGAAVLNNSWGSVFPVSFFTRADVEAGNPETIAAYQRAVDAGTVIVFAAGNAALVEPSLLAGLPFLFPEFQDLWVAAMAVDLNGDEPFYTNRCGVAAAWCIAAPGGGDAPGSGVYSTLPGGYGRFSGTSMAAPHVSGALAVILQLFQGLTPEEAVERLFVSANSTGIYADSSIFGHGLLDLEAATRPIGTIFVLTGETLSGPTFALDTTRISLGSAFGDSLRNSLAGVTLAVFDSYDAPFYVDVGAFVQSADTRTDTDRLLHRFGKFSARQTVAYGYGELSYAFSSSGDDVMAPGREPETELEELSFTQPLTDTSEFTFNYNAHPALAFGLQGSGTVDRTMMVSIDAFAAPYLSFAESGYNIATTTELSGLGTLRLGSFFGETEGEDSGESFGAIAELDVPVGKRANLAFQLGLLSESETFLGSQTEGAFDLASGVPTYFAGLSGEVALTDTWRLVGSAYAGLSYPEAAELSLFADVSPILTQSFTAGIVGDGVLRDGDRLGFLINQPLRVTSGSAELAFATGRDTERNVLSETFTADLAPNGREVDVEAFYSLALAEQTTLATSAMLRLEPGHIEGATPEGVFILRFEYKF